MFRTHLRGRAYSRSDLVCLKLQLVITPGTTSCSHHTPPSSAVPLDMHWVPNLHMCRRGGGGGGPLKEKGSVTRTVAPGQGLLSARGPWFTGVCVGPHGLCEGRSWGTGCAWGCSSAGPLEGGGTARSLVSDLLLPCDLMPAPGRTTHYLAYSRAW